MKLVQTLLTTLGLVAIAAVLFLGVSEFKKYNDLKARHDCAQDYHLEFYDQNTATTVIKPIDDLYAVCLTEKGL